MKKLENKYDITLIRGIPGSGKSTLAEKMCEEGKVFINLETDNYWIRPDGTYDWNPKFIKEAHEWNFNNAVWWLSRGNTVVIANTFTRIKEMQPYIDLAEERNYSLQVIRCMGQYKNTHGVPDETVQKMANRFEDYDGESTGGEDNDMSETVKTSG